jgi:sodium/potassium/calcium exchanger 6
MDSGAGSLAIGELIGAAFFIVAIVSGCMGIIRPFQSQKITFKRDASFLTGAIMIITWIVYHQRIYWYHSIILICYYLSYVCAVVLGAYTNSDQDPISIQKECKKDDTVDESTHLLFKAGSFPHSLHIL